MSISGVNTIDGKQIIAAGASSARSAQMDSLGRDITATYLTAVTGDNVAYTAGSNIDITDHVISGKSWTDDITAASSYAYNQATANAPGKTYEGISPIVVDNDLDKISANTYQLAVESPLQIVPSSVNGNDYQVIQLTGGVPTQSVPHIVKLYDTITWDELISAYENSGIVNPAIAHIGGNYYAHIHDKSVGSFSSFAFTFDRSISSKMSITYSSNGNTTGVYTSTREIAPSTVEAICMSDSQSAYEVLDPGNVVRYCVTVPYEYNDTYPQYRFTVNNKDFIINSGCYVEIQKAQVEGSVNWCVCHSGYYNN